MVEITWFGHACFLIKGRNATVLMDPVPAESGYTLPSISPDIVTISHEHQGHAALDLVQGDYRLVNGPGEYEIKEVFINGIRTWHDSQQGAELGRNILYVVEMEDLTICHLGDLGHALTEQQVEAMSAVDVLLVPAGGGPTITPTQAAEVIGQVEPSIVIPMQFRTEKGDAEREPVDAFVREMAAAEHRTVDRLTVRKSDLGESASVVVLEPA